MRTQNKGKRCNPSLISLVKKMREAQNNSAYKYLTYCNNIEELRRLESEVDEYLKKMDV